MTGPGGGWLARSAIDVDRLMLDDPALVRTLSEAALALVDSGAVPPVPVTVHHYADFTPAFRAMQKGAPATLDRTAKKEALEARGLVIQDKITPF